MKTLVKCATTWMSYKDYAPLNDRFIIVIKINNNGYIYELHYLLYSEIEEDCPDIKWIDTPKTISNYL